MGSTLQIQSTYCALSVFSFKGKVYLWCTTFYIIDFDDQFNSFQVAPFIYATGVENKLGTLFLFPYIFPVPWVWLPLKSWLQLVNFFADVIGVLLQSILTVSKNNVKPYQKHLKITLVMHFLSSLSASFIIINNI